MKTSLNIQFSFVFCVLLLITVFIPLQNMAQRFNHANSGGGNKSNSMPVNRTPANTTPARTTTPVNTTPARTAPVNNTPTRTAPVTTPVVQQNRATINGGSRNVGNHDFNQNIRHDEHENVIIRRDVHEDRNVYHRNNYRGFSPSSNHPYHPYNWGPRWHPLGFFLTSLAANFTRFYIANQWYYYNDGCYYMPYNGGYTVVAPPINAVISSLPDGYETTLVGDTYYYYYAGTFYINNGQGYQVVAAPAGAVISQLPDGATEQNINGDMLLLYNNTYYEPISEDGQDAYQVVPMN